LDGHSDQEPEDDFAPEERRVETRDVAGGLAVIIREADGEDEADE
jgi:hypothetical protein